ncbi:FAD/NAD(P)-binding protein [Streptomyces sioyaensis]|uniref:FAD/NAD(P)-binding protein n=1 Tax=Streptomyces sioyaensis TaxID=67364 RepID=UPI0033D1B897
MHRHPLGSPHSISVIGAGTAGTLTCIHLAEVAARLRVALALHVIDPASDEAANTPFATPDSRHLLNVAVDGMSCYPDDPHHFLRWLTRHGMANVSPKDFLPRHHFGTYLSDSLAEAVGRAGGLVTVERVRARAADCLWRDGKVSVRLTNGSTMDTDSAVVAIGPPPPGSAWAPAALRASERFVDQVWAENALAGPLASDEDILVVGTGLTAVDMVVVLDRPGRRIHAVSRHGLLPRAHAVTSLAPAPPPTELVGLPLRTARARILRHVQDTVRRHGDWRPALDGLRPLTAVLWRGLSDDDRRRFLRRDRPVWEAHRHRMASQTAEAMDRLMKSRRFCVHPGEVASVRRHQRDDALTVALTGGKTFHVGWVLNCTGPDWSASGRRIPLIGLFAEGHATPGPLGIGCATTDDGRLVNVDGSAPLSLWTLGALRRGELWESTAVPELRAQAMGIAESLLKSLVPARQAHRRRWPKDQVGHRLSTNAAAAEAYRHGLDALMKVRSGADRAFLRATQIDPGFALGHAALAILGHEGGSDVDAAQAIAQARGAVRLRGNDHERHLIDVISRRIHSPDKAAEAALLSHLRDHPRDVLALSCAVPTIAFSGVTHLRDEAAELVERTTAAHHGHWFHTSLLSFIRQGQNRFDEAGALAERVLDKHPAAGHAVHSMAHLHYECGRHEAGSRWLHDWVLRHGSGAMHQAHFSWHVALHELAMDDTDAVRRRWRKRLSPCRVRGVRALIDSASLVWRARLADCWRGPEPIGDVLEVVDPGLVERPASPFVALHSVVALAAARDLPALRRLRRHAAYHSDPVMRESVPALCDAFTAVVEERWATAVDGLRAALPRLMHFGGSAAQLEVVEETLLFTLVAAGRSAAAAELLQNRLDRRPSPLDSRRLSRVAAGLAAAGV